MPIVLLNFLLAIIVDSFTRVKEHMGKSPPVPQEFYDVVLSWAVERALRSRGEKEFISSEGKTHTAIHNARVLSEGHGPHHHAVRT